MLCVECIARCQPCACRHCDIVTLCVAFNKTTSSCHVARSLIYCIVHEAGQTLFSMEQAA